MRPGNTGGWVDESAWELRRAFEAIKYGLSLRDTKYSSHAFSASRYDTFSLKTNFLPSRFNSPEYMEFAQSKSLFPLVKSE